MKDMLLAFFAVFLIAAILVLVAPWAFHAMRAYESWVDAFF